jgi:hypothetical protein
MDSTPPPLPETPPPLPPQPKPKKDHTLLIIGVILGAAAIPTLLFLAVIAAIAIPALHTGREDALQAKAQMVLQNIEITKSRSEISGSIPQTWEDIAPYLQVKGKNLIPFPSPGERGETMPSAQAFMNQVFGGGKLQVARIDGAKNTLITLPNGKTIEAIAKYQPEETKEENPQDKKVKIFEGPLAISVDPNWRKDTQTQLQEEIQNILSCKQHDSKIFGENSVSNLKNLRVAYKDPQAEIQRMQPTQTHWVAGGVIRHKEGEIPLIVHYVPGENAGIPSILSFGYEGEDVATLPPINSKMPPEKDLATITSEFNGKLQQELEDLGHAINGWATAKEIRWDRPDKIRFLTTFLSENSSPVLVEYEVNLKTMKNRILHVYTLKQGNYTPLK